MARQLGQEWHARLRVRTEEEVAAKNHGQTRADAAFEVPLTLPCIHRGWTFKFTGRIDQLVTVFDLRNAETATNGGGPGAVPARESVTGGDGMPAVALTKAGAPPSSEIVTPRDNVNRPSHGRGGEHRSEVSIIIREIKTVSGPLPADEGTLRTDYPGYFLQTIAYLALLRSAPRRSESRPAMDAAGDQDDSPPLELGPFGRIYVAGRAHLCRNWLRDHPDRRPQVADDETSFHAQLERLAEFLDLQIRARDRLRGLQFRPAFTVAAPRPGNGAE